MHMGMQGTALVPAEQVAVWGQCPASFWMGMTATLWLGMSGGGKGPAGGFGGALWCPGCRGGGQVVAVSRSRG